ncbi:MAG: hypothetical protein NVSMB45_04170 [Ginsengibacter sp.]
MSVETTFILIDDKDWELFLHKELILLSNPDCKIEIFLNGFEALAYIKNSLNPNNRNIILSDIHMPLMSGYEILEEIKKNPAYINHKIEFYFLSATLDREELKKSTSMRGIDGFFHKPLSTELITEKLFGELQCAV